MTRVRLPTTVWALGIVSLLTDVSSELVHALLPLLLAGPLGASMLMIGLIEGAAEATASIVKLFSGALSDRIGRCPDRRCHAAGTARCRVWLAPVA